MGIAGNRIHRRSRRARPVRAPVRDRAGHTACPDSHDRVFHSALLVANLRHRPDRRIDLRPFAAGVGSDRGFRPGTVRLLYSRLDSCRSMGCGASGYALRLGS